ncbi:recombinase family protein [Acutalibacter muris]|uniref:recombinase family protein n=1 Tax=Acutalibacter muris TaxID=1796620 RepID=UPI002729A143|nr:recombinase family protein [Acutalibacter muris]
MARKSRKNQVSEVSQLTQVKVWRAALYIRLSVEFNGKRGDSLETQRQIMEAYIALCPDIEIAGVYTDNGTTGRTFERPAFQQMLSDVEAGKINCIVVKDLSRLGRNTIDTGFYIEKYFPLHGVRFISVNDQFDSEDSENSGSHLIVPLKNMINEAYAADISRKVRSQLRQAMQEGRFVGSRPPYGYLKDPQNCHKLVVNPDTAPVVQQIFKWAADGVSKSRIVLNLNEKGILSPGYYLASIGLITNTKLMGSGVWQTRTLDVILIDEVYLGDMVQGKTKTIGHRQVVADPSEWVVVRGTHEPLVSRELFAQVQASRERMAERYTRTTKEPYSINILKGRVFCGGCGKNLHRQRHHMGYYIYHCISNERIGENSCTANIYMRESELFNLILTIIQKKTEAVLGESLRLKQCKSKIAAQKARADTEIAELRRKTEKNRELLAGLYESFVKGVLTKTEYFELKEDYSNKISGAVERVQLLQAQQSELERQMEDLTGIADNLAAVGVDTELNAQLVDKLIRRITVNSPEDVSIDFTFDSGFERVREVLENG